MLHKSNINVAIVLNWSRKWSLYNLPELKCRKSGKKGMATELFLGWIFVYPNFFSSMNPNEPEKHHKPSKPGRLYGFSARYLIIEDILGILSLKIELRPFFSVNGPSNEMRELDPCDDKQCVSACAS